MAKMTEDDQRNLCGVIHAERSVIQQALSRLGFTGWANPHGDQVFGGVHLRGPVDLQQLHVVVYPLENEGPNQFVAAAHLEPSATVDITRGRQGLGPNVGAHALMFLGGLSMDRTHFRHQQPLLPPPVANLAFAAGAYADYDRGSVLFQSLVKWRDPGFYSLITWLAPGQPPQTRVRSSSH